MPVIRTYEEIASEKPRHRFPGTQRHVTTITFAPDGKWVVTSGVDTTMLVWDVTAPAKAAPAGPLAPQALEALWTDLTGADAAKAYRAICVLATKPGQAALFLGNRLRPAIPLDAKKIERLIADLDSDRFVARRDAEQTLETLGEEAEFF